MLTEDDVRRKTLNLLKIHGFTNVEVAFGNARAQAGSTRFIGGKPTKITFSRIHIEAQGSDFLNIIKHEVAHVIAGQDAGHGDAWKTVMLSMGGRPERHWDAGSVSPETRAKIFPWVYSCSNCYSSLGATARKRDYRHLVTKCCSAKVKVSDLRLLDQ